MQKTLLLLSFLLVLLSPLQLSAQDEAGPDELYRLARTEAFERENYAEAIRLAEQALSLAPEYTGIKVFLGRVYYWNGNTEKGTRILQEVLVEDPDQNQARISLADIYIETGRYAQALELMEEGLRRSPSDPDFLFKAGYSAEQSGKDRRALGYYRQVVQIRPSYPFVEQRINALNVSKQKWTATAQFSYDWIDQGFDPWQLGLIRLGRRTEIGTIGLNVQYGSRFGLNDNELELYAYPILGQKTYSYLAISFSSGEFFPEYRLSGNIYRSLPGRFETGLGYRYLSFSDADVHVLDASLLKFTPRYRFGTRFFGALNNGNTDLTALLLLRRYFGNTDHFLDGRLGYGSAATEFNSAQDIRRLDSWQAALQYQLPLGSLMLRTELGYFNEEFRVGLSRNRYQMTLGVDYLF